jgi:hypothetical protein
VGFCTIGELREMNEAGKKPYEPPHVVKIYLRPEEAVLTHCKIAGGSGPIGASCNILIVQCQTIGS